MLGNRTTAALAAARLVSLTGSNMTVVALPWFVLVTTGSPARMGLVLAAQLAPVALLGIPSGGVLGALGPRRTMVAADLARVPIVAAIPVLHWAGALSFAALLALAFATGSFRAPYGAAVHVLIPDLVGEDEALVARTNAFFQTITQGTAIFAPVVAGVLVAVAGAPAVIVIDAATFAASGFLLLAFVRRDEAPEVVTAGGRLLDGLRFLVSDTLLLPLVCAATVMTLAHESLVGVLPVLAFDRFGRASAAGLIFAADGVGSVLGSVVVMHLTHRYEARRLIALASLVMAAALWPLSVRLPLGAVASTMFVFGFGSMLFVPPLVSMLTLRVPPPLRPKVMTAYMTLMTLAGPVGLAAAGPAVQGFGLRAVFLGIAAAFTVGAVGLMVVLAARATAEATSAPTSVATG